MSTNEKYLIKKQEGFLIKLFRGIKKIFFKRKNKDLKEKKEENTPKNEVTLENNEKENLQEKLERLQKEYYDLELSKNQKIEELKKVRIKELKLTLSIYQYEESYLREVLKEKINEYNLEVKK